MSTRTRRQEKELQRIIRDVQEHFGIEVRSVDDFTFHYLEEYRPGRGHDIRFNFVDGDYAISGFMDVYGSTSLGVATVDFLHQNEDCACSMCGADVPCGVFT